MAFRRSFGRAIGVLILAATPWVLLAIGVHAQAPPNLPPPGAYQPIPNFAGVGAGLQFRQAINDRFSGVVPTAPAVVRLAFANLPTEQDGALIYCTNCTKTIPCVAGGSGAWAMGQNGQWMCGAPAFSPISDVNFNAHRATNLASGAVAGDALTFGQVGSQLGAYIQPSVVGVSTALPSSTSVTINKPSGTVAGELLVFGVGVYSPSLVVTPPVSPGTWTVIRTDCASDRCQALYQKVAGSSEPSTYTFTLSTGGFGEAAMLAIANQNVTSPIDGASSANTNSTPASVTIPAPTTSTPKDLNLVFFSNPGFPHTLTAPALGKPIVDSGGAGFGGFYYSSSTTAATVTAVSAGGTWAAAQVAIAPTTLTGAPAIRDTPTGFTSSTATNTPNYSGAANAMTGYSVDGMFNVIAYGADPTGIADNGPAFTAAYNAACAAYSPPTGGVGAIYIPIGNYNFFSPFLATCPSTNGSLTPDIVGAGKTATVLFNNIGHASAIGGGPLLELAAPTTVSSFGGQAGLITAGLTATGGNSFNWGTNPALFNLDQILGDQALNGKPQLDLRVIFNTSTNAAIEYLISSDGSAQPLHGAHCQEHIEDSYFSCFGAVALWLGSDGKLRARINTSVTGVTVSNALVSASPLSANATYMAELSYDGANVRLLHGTLGGTSTMDAKVAQTGTIVQRTDENLVVGALAEYWSMVKPSYYWQGKMDSVQVSTIARCTNDSGCSIPNAKLSGDSSTLFLENWGNVSNLPLVEAEYTNGQATDQNMKQSWMSMYNIGIGSSQGNSPTIRDLSIRGGQVGIHANAVAPHLQRIDMSGGPNYGIMLDQINDYGGTIDDVQLANNVLPLSIVGGITFVTRIGVTCGVTCMELVGTSVRDAILLPPARTQWAIILSSGAHLDDIILDTENGGAFTVIQMSDMANTTPPSLELSSSEIASWGAKMPITVDGLYQSITVTNTQLIHGGGVTGPFIDLGGGQQNSALTSGISFQNDTFDGKPEPTDIVGNSYVSPTDRLGSVVQYAVIGGGSTRQTTLAGTTAGTFVWSMPGESSSYKRFVGHYTGYNNTSATAQTVTYPVPFTQPPKITSNDGPSGSTSATALTLPASMGTPVTGWIIVEGY